MFLFYILLILVISILWLLWNNMRARKRLQELELDNLQLKKEQDGMRHTLNTISHELRSPLTSIMGHLEVLQKGLVKTREDETRCIDNASKSANKLLDVIKGSIDVHRLPHE